MPLGKMSQLLADAAKENRGVGSFSVANLEMIRGAINAAEKANTPIIIQIAQVRLDTSPLHIIGPAMISAAKNAKVNVAVHLDHGTDIECIKDALKLGFTSVMFDGSDLLLEENITKTKQVVSLAKSFGADAEAEIGRIGRTESGEESELVHANPEAAVYFIKQTAIDALAVGIGNSHGVYTSAPELKFDILEKIHSQVQTPLVLHGGTGLKPEEFERAISLGMRKINIATAGFLAAFNATQDLSATSIFDISQKMADAVSQTIYEHILCFGTT